jgi:DNA-binding NarL/FixJ family response regulator
LHSNTGYFRKPTIQGDIMKILLVDDHPLFAEGLRNLLTSHGVEVIGTARDGQEGLTKARALHPDVVLMDIQMPRMDGLSALRILHAEMPEVKVVMLTLTDDDAELFTAMQCGACGYLLKSQDTGEVFEMLDGLVRGEIPLAPGLANRLLHEFGRIASPDYQTLSAHDERLTPRQWEVLTLVEKGMTYKEVGAKLNLTERTVKYHMGEIIQRLHVANRAQAVAHMHDKAQAEYDSN